MKFSSIMRILGVTLALAGCGGSDENGRENAGVDAGADGGVYAGVDAGVDAGEDNSCPYSCNPLGASICDLARIKTCTQVGACLLWVLIEDCALSDKNCILTGGTPTCQPTQLGWSAVTNPATGDLQDVFGTSATSLWAVGFDGVFRGNRKTWSHDTHPEIGISFQAVWATGSQAWVVGYGGSTIWRWEGGKWNSSNISLNRNLFGVYGSGLDDIWIVGEKGTILHSTDDGHTFNSVPCNCDTSVNLVQIWAASKTEAYAVGTKGTILFWNGTQWQPVASGITETLVGVTGAPSGDVWVVGWKGKILRKLAGGDFLEVAQNVSQENLAQVVMFASEGWAVGTKGTILHWNGAAWTAENSGTQETLRGIWGATPDDLWAVGSAGTILRRRQ